MKLVVFDNVIKKAETANSFNPWAYVWVLCMVYNVGLTYYWKIFAS